MKEEATVVYIHHPVGQRERETQIPGVKQAARPDVQQQKRVGLYCKEHGATSLKN